MLYILIQDSITNISDVETGFFNLLEELTPYFQARLAQVGDQEEKVLVAFAEGPELLTPAEVGRKIRMPTNRVTANLKRLQSAGFIRRIEKPVKGRKGTLYRLSETIYRYWYQMNSERNREMAEIFVRFIVLYYTFREIEAIYGSHYARVQTEEKAAAAKAEAPRELHYLETALSLSRQTEAKRLYALLQKKIEQKAPSTEIRNLYEELISIDQDNLSMLNSYALFLANEKDLQTAMAYYQKLADLADAAQDIEHLYAGNYNWGNALLDLARLNRDESLFRQSFEKYALAWSLIKNFKQYTHPLMVNTGLEAIKVASIIGNRRRQSRYF